jgi:hypothetical protein
VCCVGVVELVEDEFHLLLAGAAAVAVDDYHLVVCGVVHHQVFKTVGGQWPLVGVLVCVFDVAGLLNSDLHQSATAEQQHRGQHHDSQFCSLHRCLFSVVLHIVFEKRGQNLTNVERKICPPFVFFCTELYLERPTLIILHSELRISISVDIASVSSPIK